MSESVVSKNLFALLGDDNDADGGLPSAGPVSKAAAPQKTTAAAKPAAKSAAPQKHFPQDKKAVALEGDARQPRGERGSSRGNTAGRQVNRRNPGPPQETGNFEQAPERSTSSAVRPERHGVRGGRSGREHDRRSGAGNYKAGEKKDVAGKGTWGDAVTAEVDQNGTPNPAMDSEEAVAEDAVVEPMVVQEADPEDSFMTLEQFIANKKKAAPLVEVATRKANEGVDEAKWKNVTKIEKSDEEFFSDLKKPVSTASRKNKEKTAKDTVEIQQVFAPVPRDNARFERGDRSERSDRGSSRGGARGGAQRGARGGAQRGARGGHSAQVNVADLTAFPSLGSN
ncbi:hypothetical protein BASA50_003539 [Batrachochytrium salamandrivorans]|uniref:Hyaluronan/mRNA-binding protein domain-containing protein n=1 Tax=Batrachochytrium salamandrivorans TaxID=1357716 RepID=A0ABQ8FHR9_9FUNG|nr:hypothetical protein BASA60_008226 [Batrachochytrium salamandrivorans]KAH6574891.1 hypothetical protein BASA62_002256 [Batrachochytrium salamandrivorans]KAH6592069.1 hypothetical protein BASA61_004705 [Batrachochytrium salamandrivorans]KAH6598500.1 hypothetical protein BASA50_003539 [Batrachochytrium salamandrivorans]KAH9266785.1 hypothetical protein BASA84_000961 [Batrachochytrium salamandrivorans]